MKNGITLQYGQTAYTPWHSTPPGATSAVFAALIVDSAGSPTLTAKVKTRNREDADSGADATNATFVSASNTVGVHYQDEVDALKDQWRIEWALTGDSGSWLDVVALHPVFYAKKHN